MADTKITALTLGVPLSTDIMPYVSDPGGSPVTKKTLVSSLIQEQALPTWFKYGLTLSNNGSDATNDIDIAVGNCRDSTDAANMILASALTKRLDAAWAVGTNQGGLDTGSIANTTYHVWLIKRSDTGVVDALFSTSATAPTMPANYDYKRRIGSILRVSAAILPFVQTGNKFMLKTPLKDVDTGSQSNSSVTYTLDFIPTGIEVESIIWIGAYTTGASSNAYVRSLTAADVACTNPDAINLRDSSAGNGNGAIVNIMTNTSAQIAVRAGGALTAFYITVHGWRDVNL